MEAESDNQSLDGGSLGQGSGSNGGGTWGEFHIYPEGITNRFC